MIILPHHKAPDPIRHDYGWTGSAGNRLRSCARDPRQANNCHRAKQPHSFQQFGFHTDYDTPLRNLLEHFSRKPLKAAKTFAKMRGAMTPAGFRIALVTAPDLKTARRLAGKALDARLIACANFIPRVESHYRWQGKIERDSEVLMILKTTARCVAKLEKLIVAEHPYDTPEFVVLDLRDGNKRYLDWLETGCKPSGTGVNV